MNWNFAICNEFLFRDWPFDRAFNYIARKGYEGVELAPFTIANNVTDIKSEARSRIRRQAESAGLLIVGLHWLLAKTGLHLSSKEVSVRTRTAEYLGELAEFCAELGGKVMVFGSPYQRNPQKGVSREGAVKFAVDTFRMAAPSLEKHGVEVALEPLSEMEDFSADGGEGSPGLFNTAQQVVDVIGMIDSPQYRLNLDCKAVEHSRQETASMATLVRRHHGLLAHFHANDPSMQGPGSGELDLMPAIRALDEVGYPGWVSVEVFNNNWGSGATTTRSIEYLKRCAANLGS